MSLLSPIIICFATLKEVWSYEDGAGVRSCVSRYPHHGYYAQQSQSPYEIYVSKLNVFRNEKIQITINGTMPFRGYMLQGLHESIISPIGKFHNGVGGVNMNCGDGVQNTISHYEGGLKNSTTVDWEPVKVKTDYVTFYATVLYNFTTFWINLQTPKVYITENTNIGRVAHIYGRRGESRLTYRPMNFNYKPFNATPSYNFRFMGN